METENLVNPIELSYTKKGKDALIMDGYMYTICNRGAIKTVWRCVNYVSKEGEEKCCAKAATYSDYELSMVGCVRGVHNHLPDPTMVEKSRLMKGMKEKYYELQHSGTDEKTRRKTMNKYVSDAMSSLPEELKSSMPSMKAIVRNLQRFRQRERELNAAPKEGVSMEVVKSSQDG